ncbi:MAG TPA: acyl-CoA dehydrogenase family protein, partial [Ktedonobacteraceae bacterium]
QETYVFPFCNGLDGAKERGCLAFAERTGGYTLADISTTARRAGDHFVLNGTKRNVIHGHQANPRVILFRMEGTTGSDGIGACVLPAQTEGLSVTVEEHRLGLLAAPSVSYTLHDVAIPQDAMLGEPGSNEVIRAATLYSILRSGVACGMVRAALKYASAYAEERIAFGRPIVSYQGIAFMLAEMAMKLDAVRLLLWNAAASWDQKVDREKLVWDAEGVQRQAIALCKSATTDAIQIMGGAGFMQDHPAEMWMRNAAAME